MRTSFPAVCAAVLLLSAARTAAAQAYQITDLGTLPGQTSSTAVGINVTGQITGYSGTDSFIYFNGVLTDLGTISGANETAATAINNKGQIVGDYTLPSLPGHTLGFLWDGGTISDPFNSATYIGGLFQTQGFEPVAINDGGQIVVNLVSNGNSSSILWQVPGNQITALYPSGGSTAYAINNIPQVSLVERPYYSFGAIWSANETTPLPTLYAPLAGYGPTPYGLNQNGDAVGESYANSSAQVHAFLWKNGAESDLGTLGGANSTARAINDYDQIVGDSDQNPATALTQDRHAFLYANGTMVDLNAQVGNISGWELLSAVGINDAGLIVGNGTYQGNPRAFLLTPITQFIVSPLEGGNTGNVTVTIFYPGTTPTSIDLGCTGNTTIADSSLTPLGPGTLHATFDLTGVQPGSCSLIVNEPDGSVLTTANAFTVEQGGAPDIQITLAGFPQLRALLSQTYLVVVQNRGNVDSGPIRIWVSFPTFLQWQSAGIPPSSSGLMNGNYYLAFDISPKADSMNPIPFLLTAPFTPDLVHKPFLIQTWKGLP